MIVNTGSGVEIWGNIQVWYDSRVVIYDRITFIDGPMNIKLLSMKKLRYLSISVTRLDDILDFGQVFKALGKINLTKSPTNLGNFYKGVKIYPFSSEITFRQLL